MQQRTHVRHHNPYDDFDHPGALAQDWTAGYEPTVDERLKASGLRGRHLTVVLIALAVLWLLAGLTLLCNVLLITQLGIGSKGMDVIQLHEVTNDAGDIDHLVQFTAHDIDLGEVVTNHGSIKGTKNKDLYVQGERVLLSTLVDRRAEDPMPTKASLTSPTSQNVDSVSVNTTDMLGYDTVDRANFILEDGRIRLDGFTDLRIFGQAGKTGERLVSEMMFSAARPRFMPDKQIKKVATSSIITNLIRSPINDSLRFEVENIAFRGNEGNRLSSRAADIHAENNVLVRTSSKGALRISVTQSSQSIYFPHTRKLQLSTSPSLSANLLASRLCVCKNTYRLFVVTGNLPCAIDPKFCY